MPSTIERDVEPGRWVRYRGVMVRVIEHTHKGDTLEFRQAPKRSIGRDDRRKIDNAVVKPLE